MANASSNGSQPPPYRGSFPTRRTSLFYEGKGYILCSRSHDIAGDIAAARCSARKQRPSALFLEISADYVLGHVVCWCPHARCGGCCMQPKKRMNRRKALGYILAISKDPDFVIGAKEVLARKPFDYVLRNDKSQVRYENGRLIAIRVLQSSLCFLVMLALWAIPALAQQRWWMLVRDNIDFYADPSICRLVSTGGHSPASFYEWANTKTR